MKLQSDFVREHNAVPDRKIVLLEWTKDPSSIKAFKKQGEQSSISEKQIMLSIPCILSFIKCHV